jgi:hypothetical protein
MADQKDKHLGEPEDEDGIRLSFIKQVPVARDASLEVKVIATRVFADVARRVDLITEKMEGRLKKLVAHIESGELDSANYEYDMVNEFVNHEGPFERTDLERGRQAIILMHGEFEGCGGLEIVLSNGDITTLDPDDFPLDDILIIYPWDLGNLSADK